MVASASIPVGERLTGNPFYFVARHAVYLFVGSAAAVIVMMIPVAKWQAYSGMLCVLAIGMLLLVLVIGTTVNGATRWIRIGPMTLQVAEFVQTVLCHFHGELLRPALRRTASQLERFY